MGGVLEGVSGTHDHDFPLHDVVVFETSRETLHRVLLELCDGRSLLESRIYTESTSLRLTLELLSQEEGSAFSIGHVVQK